MNELVHGVKAAGTYDVEFSGATLSSGVYFYTLTAAAADGTAIVTNARKLLLLK